jgi:lipopolysaccharide/colanic/teichoic acid biosynthesis glycosyltransferase
MKTAVLNVPRLPGGLSQPGVPAAIRPRARRSPRPWPRQRLLGEGLFADALVRERRCAERFGSPFAVLLLDCADGAAEVVCWAPCLRAVAGVTHDIDLVGWVKEHVALAVILPGVTGKTAIRIQHRLQRDIEKRVGSVAASCVSMTLYGYGDEPDAEGVRLPGVEALIGRTIQPRRRTPRLAAKRGLDIIGSLGLLVLFSPVLLVIYLLVKWTSPGPALFRQTRVGLNGEPFTMFKFRTMYANADHGIHRDYVTWFIKSSGQQPRTGSEMFKLTNDLRITPVGCVLRKTSLDELPQFWNVLRGDMSLVGPRPPLPFEVEQYQQWHRRRVCDAKPGLTGPWQVNGRSRTTFDEMVRLDLGYARTHSLWTDIKILAATPRAMVSGKGAC